MLVASEGQPFLACLSRPALHLKLIRTDWHAQRVVVATRPLIFLPERGVTLLSAGLDEVPMAYKDIDEVMTAQSDLVEPLAKFEPRLVKMAPSGEPPED
jgi:hypothetical protein